jgi:hypothetical protein
MRSIATIQEKSPKHKRNRSKRIREINAKKVGRTNPSKKRN